jgi:hypothetical protein
MREVVVNRRRLSVGSARKLPAPTRKALQIKPARLLHPIGWNWTLRRLGRLWAPATRPAEAVRDNALGLCLTFECGYQIVVDLDCIQGFQAEIHYDRPLVH